MSLWIVENNGSIVQRGSWVYRADAGGHVDPIKYPPVYGYKAEEGISEPVSNGVFKSYFQNMKIAHQCTISNGAAIGVWEKWYPNGKRAIFGQFDGGESTGIWIWWNSEGIIRQIMYGHLSGKEEWLEIGSNGCMKTWVSENRR